MNKALLDLYSDYLISSFKKTTATGMSELLDQTITHDRITNFLAESDLTSKELWKLTKKDIRNIESSDGVLIIDDSIEAKPYTDENEIISYHWDHSEGRSVKGVNLLSCLYHSQGYDFPLCFDIITKEETFLDPKTGKEKRRSSITKNELMREQLKQVQQWQVSYQYVLTDTWFSSSENMSFITTKLNKDFIMAFKSNRLVSLSKKEKLQGKFVSVLNAPFKESEPLTVFVKGLNFPVLLSKQVFINKDGSQGVLYLVSSDLNLTNEQIQNLYQKRWKVEEYHKSIKSNTSFAQSPTRIKKTQSNHFFSSIYAFAKLEKMKMKTKMNHFSLKAKLYINAIKASYKELHAIQNSFA